MGMKIFATYDFKNLNITLFKEGKFLIFKNPELISIPL